MEMNYKEIESLKLALLSLARKGCKLRIPSAGISGRVVGVGFRPYWTGPLDSIIEKLEINYMDDLGKVRNHCFLAVTGYDVVSNDGRGYDSMKNACIDLQTLSAKNDRGKQKNETVRLEIYMEEEN